MSLRHLALYIVIFSLSIYAWKDWFKSLCGLILLMAVIEHSDMPKSMFGIQGLNMWNVLFAVIFIVWLVSRSRENLTWDMPKNINILLLAYLTVILIGVLRAAVNIDNLSNYTHKELLSNEFINTIKWVLPGVLLFDGCRTRRRTIMAIVCILALYCMISIQIIRFMPFSAAFDIGVLDQRRISLGKYMGYSAVDMSVFLAGAFWAIIATIPMLSQKKYKTIVIAAAGLVVFGQALTGGRAGYIAWASTGLVLCLMKWRKYLLLAPIVVILLPIVFPGAVERMFTGFGETDLAGQSTIDEEALASGRMVIWPYVIDKIVESPLIGYGRIGMNRTGLTETIEIEHPGTRAGQPHNMYLETLLDNGILGTIPIVLFWVILIVYSSRLFKSNNRLCSAIGGITLSLMLAQLFAGIGSQHFYPEESTLSLWAAMFLMLRVYLEKIRTQTDVMPVDSYWSSQLEQEAAICT